MTMGLLEYFLLSVALGALISGLLEPREAHVKSAAVATQRHRNHAVATHSKHRNFY